MTIMEEYKKMLINNFLNPDYFNTIDIDITFNIEKDKRIIYLDIFEKSDIIAHLKENEAIEFLEELLKLFKKSRSVCETDLLEKNKGNKS